MVVLSCLSLACIALLTQDMLIYLSIDFTMLTFLNDNLCVDGPLRYAFRVTQDLLVYEQRLTQGALACIVLAYSI
jgi:hypothetical protein